MDLSKVVFNTADVLTAGGMIAGALATIWGVKKVLSLIAR